jgi:hypothetical protein
MPHRYTLTFPIANNTFISKAYISKVGRTLETFHRLRSLFSILNAKRTLKHTVTWLSVDRRVFDWSLDSLDIYTTRNYTLHLIVTHRLVSSVTFLGSGFQRQTFLCFWVHVLAGCRPCQASLILWLLASTGTPFSCQLPSRTHSQSQRVTITLRLAVYRQSVCLGDRPRLYPRHWVTFSSPPTTRRATVEVFDPASTREPELTYNSKLIP